VPVRDATGAGDATVGAIAVGLAAGRSLSQALRGAAAVGARCVSGHGPSALGFHA
jgi:ribokinase